MQISRLVIERGIHKEESACRSIYEESIAYVYSIVKRYIWHDENQKDIIQNIYANVFKKLHQFDPDKGSFNTWLRRIAINECLMKIRKDANTASIVPISDQEEARHVEYNDPEKLNRKDIERILSKMPSGYRTVFLLAVIDEYSHEEISDLMNISKETSRSQLSRAKSWVKKHFFSNENAVLDGIF